MPVDKLCEERPGVLIRADTDRWEEDNFIANVPVRRCGSLDFVGGKFGRSDCAALRLRITGNLVRNRAAGKCIGSIDA